MNNKVLPFYILQAMVFIAFIMLVTPLKSRKHIATAVSKTSRINDTLSRHIVAKRMPENRP